MRALLRDEQRDALRERESRAFCRGRWAEHAAGEHDLSSCERFRRRFLRRLFLFFYNDSYKLKERIGKGRTRVLDDAAVTVAVTVVAAAGVAGVVGTGGRVEGPGVPGALSFCARFVVLPSPRNLPINPPPGVPGVASPVPVEYLCWPEHRTGPSFEQSRLELSPELG